MINLIPVEQEIENDITQALDRMPGRRRPKYAAEDRKHAIFTLCMAVASVIAEDVAHGETPLARTLEKYRLLMVMEDPTRTYEVLDT